MEFVWLGGEEDSDDARDRDQLDEPAPGCRDLPPRGPDPVTQPHELAGRAGEPDRQPLVVEGAGDRAHDGAGALAGERRVTRQLDDDVRAVGTHPTRGEGRVRF